MCDPNQHNEEVRRSCSARILFDMQLTGAELKFVEYNIAVFRICKFLGDPDPLVIGMDPGSFKQKKVRKALIYTVL